MGDVAQSVERRILNTLGNACRGLEFVFLVRRRSQVQVLPSAHQFKASLEYCIVGVAVLQSVLVRPMPVLRSVAFSLIYCLKG